MDPRPGKLIARWSAALGLVVLLACAVAFRDRIAEEWWLYKLESGELEEQKVAAEKLADMGSARAVPVMLRLLGNSYPVFSLPYGRGAMFARLVPPEDDWSGIGLLPPLRHDFAFLGEALGKIARTANKASLRYLVTALDHEDWYIRYLAAWLLGAIGPDARAAIPALIELLKESTEEDPSHPVRSMVAWALARIGSAEAVSAVTEAAQGQIQIGPKPPLMYMQAHESPPR